MTKYPDLTQEKIIGFDIETYDPELKDKGPGIYRKDGCVLGVAISNGDFKEYYGLNHKDCYQDTIKNSNYLQHLFESHVPKVGANVLYDLDWLVNQKEWKINGNIHDVQIAQPLICEYQNSFSLDTLSDQYLNLKKKTHILEQWCQQNNIRPTKSDPPASYIYMMPFETVREYALEDAYLPIEILKKQLPILEEQNLMGLYRMEMDLTPLLLQMRKIGVRLNVPLVNEKIRFLKSEISRLENELYSKYGEFNVKSGAQIAPILDANGVPYKRHEPTELMIAKGVTIGNPKLDKDSLKEIDHPIVRDILNVREYRTALSTFFINSYTEMRVGERIHSMFNPLRSDEYGTVSGRFSSTKPNLQQQPGKGEIGHICREVFIPEDGCLWGKLDWSQIEYRIIAHYARGDKSELVRERYTNDPKTDYHQMVMDWTGLERKEAKMLNFGMAYFMGAFACSKKFGWSMDEAKDFINLYHSTVPFVKATRTHVVKIAKLRGYVKTILNRRARISPFMIENRKEHSIFNRLIQGSAADIMKKSMIDAYKAGLFNVLIPHIIVHDEWDVSVPKTKYGAEAVLELKNIMENCVKLRVPIISDLEIGENWADVSAEKAENFIKGELK